MDLHRYHYAPHLGHKLLSLLLLPCSAIYGAVATLKRLTPRILYGKQGRDFGLPIISVGNLIAGGSGKTPFIIALCRHLCAFEYGHIAIISRGYKRDSKGLVWVSKQGVVLADVATSGDEPYLIATTLAGQSVSVIVCKNRAKAIAQAKAQGADLVLLDDGFRFCFKKFDVLLRPALEPFYHYFLPSGLYRESHTLYRTLDSSPHALIAQDGYDFTREVQILNQTPRMLLLTAIASPKRLIAFLPKDLQADYHALYPLESSTPHFAHDFTQGSIQDSAPTATHDATRDSIQDSIATTQPLESIDSNRANALVAAKFFLDHHRFSSLEIMELIERHQATSLLTTQKDATKLQDFSQILSLMELTLHIHPKVLCPLRAYLRDDCNDDRDSRASIEHISIADYLYTSPPKGAPNLPSDSPLQVLRTIEQRLFASLARFMHKLDSSLESSLDSSNPISHSPYHSSILLAWAWLPCDTSSAQSGLLDEALAILENAFYDGLVDFWLDGRLYASIAKPTSHASLAQSFSHKSSAWKYVFDALFSPLLAYCRGDSSSVATEPSLDSSLEPLELSWDSPELFTITTLRIGLSKKGKQYYTQLLAEPLHSL